MSRLTAALSLITTLVALPASAAGLSAHCVRDGSRTSCAWSMVQPIDLVIADWTSPKAQPVPLCLDCEPLDVALTCTLVDDGERAMVRCVGAIEGIDD